ncbi:MAG: alkaline phosphatase D family protein [Deltaproteobacteria bacterium]|nr:alkaline phosphatase D family protein [Deltaproteobacteria bacterium]
MTHGVQAGEPEVGRALIWARCDEPARMVVEWDTTERFANPKRVAGDVVTPLRDHCGTAELSGLPDAQTVVYRIRFEREAARGASAWTTGKLRTPKSDRVRVAWTGDTCGQGFGHHPDTGGMRGFAAIRSADPDLFINSGDMIYADNPILAERVMPTGVWKNTTNERVGRVAQELDDFRARFAYNFDDEHLRALAAEVPVIAQWDDHEIHNNWFPGQQLADDRYDRERDASKLAAMARQAMFEWVPLRTGPIHRVLHHGPLLDVFVLDCRAFRSPNTANLDDELMFGAAQVAWLLDALAASKARWKIIACDQPIALVIDDGPVNQEGFANTDPGAPRGREKELARLLAGMRERKVANTVWVTADVHYAAAHHFDPKRAAPGVEFDPFWEFVAGPIHAGNFGPNELDASLGPAVKFQWGTPPPNVEMLSPADGKQSFGTLDVTRDALTVTLRDIDGHDLHRVDIPTAS